MASSIFRKVPELLARIAPDLVPEAMRPQDAVPRSPARTPAQFKPRGFDTKDAAYREHMLRCLMATKFANASEAYQKSPQFQPDITEEQYRRVDRFHDCLVPWVSRVMSLDEAVVAEVGSGTGSTTLAFAPYVKRIHCFEIESSTVAIAKQRLSFFNIENVIFEEGLYSSRSSFLSHQPQLDMVLLVAVLEHLYFHEFQEGWVFQRF